MWFLSAASVPGPGRGDCTQTLGWPEVESEVNPDALKEAERHVVIVGGAWVSVLALTLTAV